MKLFVYDHCPYCTKARMIFGLKKVPVEVIYLLNDDEKTPIEMIGEKMLPILEVSEKQFMPESLDIINSIDKNKEFGAPIVFNGPDSVALKDWLAYARKYNYALAMPRWIVMDLPEFATPSSVAYFTKKKMESIGPFEQNLMLSTQITEFAEKHLTELENLYSGGKYFWGDNLTWDDFHVFAIVRCLTTVEGLTLPKKVNDYMNRMSSESGVPLHWDRAL